MPTVLDVKQYAYEMLEKAKQNLQRDKCLPPVGFLLKGDGTVLVGGLDMRDQEARRRSRNALSQTARNEKAIAIITITDSTFQAFPAEEKHKSMESQTEETPRWLLEAQTKPGHCIEMTIEVPRQVTTVVMVPYHKNDRGDFEYEEPDEGPLDFKGPAPPSTEEEEGPEN